MSKQNQSNPRFHVMNAVEAAHAAGASLRDIIFAATTATYIVARRANHPDIDAWRAWVDETIATLPE